jgi:MoaA/NifB/PqqE/SkfB family radical SAM enzyme
MGIEEWKKFAKYLVERGGIFQCVISGGEPLLLGDGLFEIMDILHEDGTSFLIITNAYLLTREKAKKFAKYRYKWFQISIDGDNKEFHDGFRQKEGSWERAVNGAYMISKEGIPLTIAHSVTPGNVYRVDKMCRLAYELGAGNIILGEVTPSGRSANNLELLLSREEKNYLYQKIDELSAMYSGRMKVQRSSTAHNQLTRYVNTPNSGAIIRPNGDIRLDCMAPFVLGNIFEDDFEKQWKEKAGTCWENEKVQDYIKGFNIDDDINIVRKNYFDEDIRL